MTVATAACEASTRRYRVSPSGFGLQRVPCAQTVGVSSFVDAAGITRRHCSIDGHRRELERIYGVAQPAEPEWTL